MGLAFSPAAASVRSSGFVLDDSLRCYLEGVGLDLLASLLLVWATVGFEGLPLRLSLALALFVGLHLFGGWQREPQELAFSVMVLLWVVSFGAHARARAAARARYQTLRRTASWATYWQGQLVGFLRQIAFESVAVLALLASLTVDGLLVLKAVGR
jgi:hypothetical protein